MLEKVQQCQQIHHLNCYLKKLCSSRFCQKATATFLPHFLGHKHFPFGWIQTCSTYNLQRIHTILEFVLCRFIYHNVAPIVRTKGKYVIVSVNLGFCISWHTAHYYAPYFTDPFSEIYAVKQSNKISTDLPGLALTFSSGFSIICHRGLEWGVILVEIKVL